MQSQRGSVTVIAIAMLLFLMLIAVAWLPMMTMEKTAASSDYREQQAWYAAEAGYKRAVAALKNKNTDWSWITPEKYLQGSDSMSFIHLSIDGSKVDQKGVWYAVGIMENNVDIDSSYTPEENIDYQITSVGSCQGIRKVIRKTYVLSDTGGSGGGGSDDTDLSYMSNTLVMAGGTVKVNKNQHINQDVDIDDSFGGDLYGKNIIDINDNQAFEHNNVKGQYGKDIKTRIPDKVFEQATYPGLNTDKLANFGGTFRQSITLKEGEDYYWDVSNASGRALHIDASKSSGRTIFIDNSKKIDSIKIESLDGPESGEPLTLVFSSSTTVKFDGKIVGRIRILAAGGFEFGDQDPSTTAASNPQKDRFMLLANGNIIIRGAINPGFVSANGNVTMERSPLFIGQIQCRGDFSVDRQKSSDGKYTYGKIKFNDTVLKDKYFKVPAGMTAG